MHATPHRAGYVLCSALVCLLMVGADPSHARACRVDLFGVADAAWREAAARQKLSADDCAAVHVEVEGDHALVTLIRSDARRVARALSALAQLGEAIDALKVADPDELAPSAVPRVETALIEPTAFAQPAGRATAVMFGCCSGFPLSSGTPTRM